MEIIDSKWTDEAYVSLHLVQEILRQVVPTHDSEWYPEHVISQHNRVDFFIKDNKRKLEFLIEVKAAKKSPIAPGIDEQARQQLATYFYYSSLEYGFLIDPFSIECYQVINNHPKLVNKFDISNPNNLDPAIKFLRGYMNSLTDMRTIVIHTSKGGVGKTTLTVNVAFELARLGNRVLVVDLDDQANASLSLGVNRADEMDKVKNLAEFENILESFESRKEVIDFIKENGKSNFDYKQYIYPSNWNSYLTKTNENGDSVQIGTIDVLPGSYRTHPKELSAVTVPQKLLDKGLQHVRGDYDYVIIDTSPSTNEITTNGLFAAQYLIIPSQMEYLSIYGIRPATRAAKEVSEETYNNRGKILGIVPMMTSGAARDKVIHDLVQKNFADVPLLPDIKRKVAVGRSLFKRVPLFVYAEKNKVQGAEIAKQASDLVQEIINRIDKLTF